VWSILACVLPQSLAIVAAILLPGAVYRWGLKSSRDFPIGRASGCAVPGWDSAETRASRWALASRHH